MNSEYYSNANIDDNNELRNIRKYTLRPYLRVPGPFPRTPVKWRHQRALAI